MVETPKDKDKDKGEGSGSSIDHSSPYYLHPSDVPKQLHVNEVLTDTNYADWSQEMENFLFAKNKIEFVDGTIQKPEKGTPNYMPWMRCDAMVKGWLTTAMEKTIRDNVKYAITAAQMWSDLQERFGKESSPRVYELKQKLATTRQNGTSVSTYYTALRTLWDETSSILPFPTCSCNNCSCDIGKKMVEYQEKERLYQFMMGLDPDFTVIKTQILATTPPPSLGVVYHLVALKKQTTRRIFGCLAYYKNMNTKGDKFEERGKPGIFLGYPQGTKGYKVYDFINKKMVISRDVLFCEDVFPFKQTNTSFLEKHDDVTPRYFRYVI